MMAFWSRRWGLLLVGCVLLWPAQRVAGQDPGIGWSVCESDRPAAAVVRGRLIPRDEGISAERTVRIREADGSFSCRVRASDEGVFEFRGVPPGAHRLTVASLDLRDPAPIRIEIARDTLLVFDIPLYGGSRLARCMSLDWCAFVLTRRTSLELAGPEEQAFRLLGYRLAIILGEQDGMFGPDWVVCLEESDEVLASLREAYPRVAPRHECERRETQLEGMTRPRQMLRHLPSDSPARSLRIDGFERITDTEANLGVSWHVGSLWAAGFGCLLEGLSGVWMPKSCSMIWIS